MSAEESSQGLSELLGYIRAQRGIDFSVYKEPSLKRRIAKRMEAVGVGDYREYLDHLQASPHEFEPLLDTIFINVTRFFRDPEEWKVLRNRVLPSLVERIDTDSELRVWCAGAASGEETYSLAILLAEEMGLDAFTERTKIFATDADENVLVRARAGRYGDEALEDVPRELREKYFAPVDGSAHVVEPEVRSTIIFGHHDLLEDAPISNLDLLVCRNTLMYFNREAQGHVLTRFHFALRPEGVLFVGRAEMLLTRRMLFEPLQGKARIFRKVPNLSVRDRLFVSSPGEREDVGDPVGDTELGGLVFDTSPTPELVVDAHGTLIMASARAREVLDVDRSSLGRLFQDATLSYRPVDLRTPVEEVMDEGETSVLRNVEWGDPRRGEPSYFDIRLAPLFRDGGGPVAVSVTFQDVTRYHELSEELRRSKSELVAAYEELQSTNDELETTNEELQSTNDELETTNEELQSTNAEIQAMNEELQRRTLELDRLNTYARAILDSVQMEVVVLDENLDVRLWNEIAEASWGLRDEEVEGKAFLDLDIGLPVQDLKEAVLECIQGGSDRENVQVEGHDRRGKSVIYEVRLVPLRHPDDGEAVSGVVLMMNERARDGSE